MTDTLFSNCMQIEDFFKSLWIFSADSFLLYKKSYQKKKNNPSIFYTQFILFTVFVVLDSVLAVMW